MRLKNIANALLFSALLLAVPAIAGAAGHIASTGVAEAPASQLIVWYDESQQIESAYEGRSLFQVTNLSTDTGVNIHVQIFADDADDADDRCREHDFNDTLTPTDTVLYVLGELDDPDEFGGIDFGGDNSFNPIAIDIDGTRGFIVVTPVDTVTLPRQAISHNHLMGSLIFFHNDAAFNMAQSFNAMGREAVNFATGALSPAGTVLDGITNGYRLIQPSFLFFNFNEDTIDNDCGDPGCTAQIVSIAFADNYSDPSGEYRAEPGSATWDPLHFDQFENSTSCQQHVLACYQNMGLDDDWPTELNNNGGDTDYGDPLLCPAASAPGFDDTGWVNIAVSGLSGLDNNIGGVGFDEDDGDSEAGASWMYGE